MGYYYDENYDEKDPKIILITLFAIVVVISFNVFLFFFVF